MKKDDFLILRFLFVWSCFAPLNAWTHPTTAADALEDRVKAQIDRDNLPKHIAIIMDGNGRWATKRGKPRIFGHRNAIQSVRAVVAGCGELGIPYLTLYAFSTENWKRSQEEVEGLMNLVVTTIDAELAELVQKNVRLHFIGNLSSLPTKCQEAIQRATQASRHNQGMRLTIALNYSGRWDLAEAARAIACDVQEGNLALQDIDAELLKQYLTTKDMPDPELLLRTSGEMRLSNFFLEQIAYTELFFTPVFWPDFGKCDLYEALLAYQKRKRRFGGSDT